MQYNTSFYEAPMPPTTVSNKSVCSSGSSDAPSIDQMHVNTTVYHLKPVGQNYIFNQKKGLIISFVNATKRRANVKWETGITKAHNVSSLTCTPPPVSTASKRTRVTNKKLLKQTVKSESPFGRQNSVSESPFGRQNSVAESPFSRQNSLQSPFSRQNSLQSPFSRQNSLQSPFGRQNSLQSPIDSQNSWDNGLVDDTFCFDESEIDNWAYSSDESSEECVDELMNKFFGPPAVAKGVEV